MQRLTDLGYRVELQTGLTCNPRGTCGTPTNIVAQQDGTAGAAPQRAGAGTPADSILLAAHYDSVGAGPGASDDGTGVAAVLEIARILKLGPTPRHPIVLLLTDGEEAGLLGAMLFVREGPWAKRCAAAVNLDARGTSGPSLMFETGDANTALMHLYGQVMNHPLTDSLFYAAYRLLPNGTDFTIFKAASMQGYNFAFVGDVGRYHTALDTWQNVNLRSLQHQGDNALTLLLALANAQELTGPALESVFFDVFARTLVSWPAVATLPAALSVVLLVLVEAGYLVRIGLLTGRQILWGGAGASLSLLGGLALCIAAVALLRALDVVPPLDSFSWIAHPWPMHLASVGLGCLTASAVAAWLAGRVGFWGFWAGAMLVMSILGAALAVLLPGGSFLVVVPAMAGVIAMPAVIAGGAWPGVRTLAPELAALLPALCSWTLLLPMMRLLYPSLGTPAWPALTLLSGLGFLTLLPLLALAHHLPRVRLTALAAILAKGALLVALFLPRYSAAWPQRVNLEYWLDDGGAHWLCLANSDHLPTRIGAVTQFDPEPEPRYAGSSRHGFRAAAVSTARAAPELTVISATPTGPGTVRYRLRLRSPRGATDAFVVFPAEARVKELHVTTQIGDQPSELSVLANGATRMDAVDLPAAGMDMVLDAAAGRFTAQVFDQTPGLPAELPLAAALVAARRGNAVSSQDGDVTVVQHTVSLDPAADRSSVPTPPGPPTPHE